MDKLTDWIKVSTHQPAIPGWYDVRLQGNTGAEEFRLYWTGLKWSRNKNGTKHTFGNWPKRWPRDAWRGLAQDPSTPTTDAPQAKGSEVVK